jgi:uncharacterized phage protein (TIGR02218 family)
VKNYSTAYAAHLQQSDTTLAVCWRIVKNNGALILGTSHDRDIPITQTNIGVVVSESAFSLVGVYRASSGILGSDIASGSDMSVDNMEVNGALQRQGDLHLDVSVADLESGLLDSAEVTTFLVNWQNPDDFQDVMRHGSLGEVFRTSEGHYRSEVRGITQQLQQTIGRTCGDKCDVAEFGDARCKFNVASATASGLVTNVASRRRFDSTLVPGSFVVTTPNFRTGKLSWLTGENAGFVSRVKVDNVDGVLGKIELEEEAPFDIEDGDTFNLAPGCDRRPETCRDVYNNLINIRAPGMFCPGPDKIIAAP